jgi:NADPH2:quinone reductase
MYAQIIRSFGEPDVFELAELLNPAPKAGEVLVRVAATSVNPVDYKVRRFGPAIAPPLPAVLGCDLAGTVEALGPGVAGFAIGDRVYGCAGGVAGVSGGAYAELIAADARLLAPAPASLGLREAAALPPRFHHGWEGLFDRTRLEPGQTVLVHGGAGGVGHVAIQLAKAHGAVVHATVSSAEKAALARRLGADETINYREERRPRLCRAPDRRRLATMWCSTRPAGDDLGPSFAARASTAKS